MGCAASMPPAAVAPFSRGLCVVKVKLTLCFARALARPKVGVLLFLAAFSRLPAKAVHRRRQRDWMARGRGRFHLGRSRAKIINHARAGLLRTRPFRFVRFAKSPCELSPEELDEPDTCHEEQQERQRHGGRHLAADIAEHPYIDAEPESRHRD